MTKAKEDQTYDLRTLEQFIRDGAVNSKDYQSYLKSLPNSESNADYVEVYEEPVSTTDPTQPESSLTFRPAEPRS